MLQLAVQNSLLAAESQIPASPSFSSLQCLSSPAILCSLSHDHKEWGVHTTKKWAKLTSSQEGLPARGCLPQRSACILSARCIECCHLLGYSFSSPLAPSRFFVLGTMTEAHRQRSESSEGGRESSVADGRACPKLAQRSCLPHKASYPELLLKITWLGFLHQESHHDWPICMLMRHSMSINHGIDISVACIEQQCAKCSTKFILKDSIMFVDYIILCLSFSAPPSSGLLEGYFLYIFFKILFPGPPESCSALSTKLNNKQQTRRDIFAKLNLRIH